MYAIKDIKSATQIIKILVHHWYTHKWGNKNWRNLSKKVVVSRSWSCVHWPMRRWLIWRAFLNAVLLLLCQAHQGWLILVPSKKIVIYKQWKDINNDSHSVCISPKRKKIHKSWRIYASKDIKSATQVSYLAPSNLSKDLMLASGNWWSSWYRYACTDQVDRLYLRFLTSLSPRRPHSRKHSGMSFVLKFIRQ